MRNARTVLRGPTPWALPCWFVGLSASSLCLLTVMWLVRASATDRPIGVVLAAVCAAAAVGSAVARSGCRVIVTDEQICDQVYFWTRWTVTVCDVDHVEVTDSPWRWFVLRLDDETTRVVAGAGPTQFPLTLVDRAGRADEQSVALLEGRPGAVDADVRHPPTRD